MIAIPGPPPPDQAAADSTTSAFEALYTSVGPDLLAYALRRAATREAAVDVVAETFLAAWRRRVDLPSDATAQRPWLFGIARHCLANSARGDRRASSLGQRLAAGLDVAALPDPARVLEGREDAALVRAALDQLSPDDRELVTLTAWDGLTPAQAAAALGLTPGNARVRLHRARARLSAALTPVTPEEPSRDH